MKAAFGYAGRRLAAPLGIGAAIAAVWLVVIWLRC